MSCSTSQAYRAHAYLSDIHISQGSAATRFGCGGWQLCFQFSEECVGKRIFEVA